MRNPKDDPTGQRVGEGSARRGAARYRRVVLVVLAVVALLLTALVAWVTVGLLGGEASVL